MYKLNRVGVASLAVLLTYNAYAAGGYVCDTIKMYQSCDYGYYLTAGGVYSPTPTVQNDCTACPTGAAGCGGGTYAPIYTVTLNPNGGTFTESDQDTRYFYTFQDTNLKTGVCPDGSFGPGDWGDCIENATSQLAVSGETSVIPTREKYAFLGYGTTQDATKDSAVVSSTGVVDTTKLSGTQNTTLYAIWERSVCEANEYLDNGKCEACPAPYANSNGGSGGIDSCYLTTSAGKYVKEAGNGEVDCEAGSWCAGGIVVAYNQNNLGATACPTNYDDGGKGLSLESQCLWNVPAGSYIKTAKDTTATACVSGEWKDEHSVRYGDVSVANKCTPLDGMAAASKAPFNSEETCYISASTTLNDGKGSYIFTEDCNYTESAN